MLNIPNIGGGGKYLGLSEQFNGRKSETFKYIKDNVHTKIHGWQTRFLSTAGKEILLKAVAFAMPVFSMNVFELPMQVGFELDSMISGYWWGSTENQRKLAWVSWKKMTFSKQDGGMGFRELHKFNQALLANQV